MTTTDKLTDSTVKLIADNKYWPTSNQTLAMARELIARRRASQAAPAPSDALREENARLRDEVERLSMNTTRFPEHMARIIAAKDQPLDDRVATLVDAMQKLPDYLHKYQWIADQKPLFGDKRISVGGDDGEGTGRQWIADTPSHLTGLAEYIAAANPDTVAMLIAALSTPTEERQ